MKHIPLHSNKSLLQQFEREKNKTRTPKLDKEGNIEISDEKKALFRAIATKRAEEFERYLQPIHNPGKEIEKSSKRIEKLKSQISETKIKRAKCEAELKEVKEEMVKVGDKINQLLKQIRGISH